MRRIACTLPSSWSAAIMFCGRLCVIAPTLLAMLQGCQLDARSPVAAPTVAAVQSGRRQQRNGPCHFSCSFTALRPNGNQARHGLPRSWNTFGEAGLSLPNRYGRVCLHILFSALSATAPLHEKSLGSES